jgi:hypothetical protein
MNANRIGSLFAIAFFQLALTGPADGQTWQATGAPSASWGAMACSADGSRILVEGLSINTSVSTNSGSTWASGLPYINVLAVGCSADGTKMVCLATDGIHVSTNSGTDWTLATNRHAYWNTVAGSADGTKWIAVGSHLADTPPSSLYISTDSGQTWQSNSLASSGGWSTAASSADGTKFAVVGGGYVYTSTNSGATWSLSMTTQANIWRITTSADAGRLVLCGPPDLFLSQDWGATWLQVTNAVKETFGYLACSADGNTLISSSFMSDAYVWLSFDGGITWAQSNLPARVMGVAVSADGSKLMASGHNGGGIYVLQRTPQPRLNIAASEANLKLS